jgi:hypothetical protein
VAIRSIKILYPMEQGNFRQSRGISTQEQGI